jgi:hypothetical protein
MKLEFLLGRLNMEHVNVNELLSQQKLQHLTACCKPRFYRLLIILKLRYLFIQWIRKAQNLIKEKTKRITELDPHVLFKPHVINIRKNNISLATKF